MELKIKKDEAIDTASKEPIALNVNADGCENVSVKKDSAGPSRDQTN